MKKEVLLLLLPTFLYAEVLNPKPFPTIEYKKERAHNTTVHSVVVAPSHSLELVLANGRKCLSSMVQKYEQEAKKNVLVAINGSFFTEHGKAIGSVVYCGKRIDAQEYDRAALGITAKGITIGYIPEQQKKQHLYLVTAGPYLIKDGKIIARQAAFREGFDSSYHDNHPRTAIGKRKDGSLVLLVTEGRRKDERGLTLEEIASVLLSKGCVEAMNLDGGGSSTLVLSGEFYGKKSTENRVENNPTDGEERPVVNGIIVVE